MKVDLYKEKSTLVIRPGHPNEAMALDKLIKLLREAGVDCLYQLCESTDDVMQGYIGLELQP